MTDKKQRLDVLLHQKNFFESRNQANAAVIAGQVRVNGKRADKPGMKYDPDIQIEVMELPPYVSRGGYKLEKALRVFRISLAGKVVLDVGSSTGGFTDCALQHGAARVYAVDVGYGQLAWKMRTDPRVVAIERTNIKNLEPEDLGTRPNFVTIDVSFISLEKVMPRVALLVDRQAGGVALIKPQFEAGREKVGKKGVVRDPAVHLEVLNRINTMMEENGWGVLGIDFSPIRGPEGNIEYLMYFDLSGPREFDRDLIRRAVEAAHITL
ncbi:MAG: TlyA family RNA methyltransferase [Bacillota bacterium]